MKFNGFIIASFIVFIASITLSFFRIKYKKDKFFTPFRIIFLGTLISGVTLFFPVYYENFEHGSYSFWISVFATLQHTFRLFAIDGEYIGYLEMVQRFIVDSSTLSKYTFMCTILYFAAPILTFTFFILMLKNFIAIIAYRSVLKCKETHVFSELNDKSVALAKSIIKNDIGDSWWKKNVKLFRKQVIVFADVIADKEEKNSDLIDEAKKLGAILFYKDVESLHIAFKKSNRKIKIYLISENENEKLKQAEYIMKNYDLTGIELYVFSESTQSQMILRDKNVKNIKVVRVNDIRTLIYHNLDRFGMRLFNKAFLRYNPDEKIKDNSKKNNDKKSAKTYNRSTISAVIIGFGRYGKEMLKALSWFCQYPNFDLKIDVFDSDKTAKDYFEFNFPGMNSRSGNPVNGEDNYTINFHPETNVNSPKFKTVFDSIENPTYIFVCLGSDEDNINAAMNIRRLCQLRGFSINDVDVETVVYDSNSARLISCIWDEDNTPALMYDTEEDQKKALAAEKELKELLKKKEEREKKRAEKAEAKRKKKESKEVKAAKEVDSKDDNAALTPEALEEKKKKEAEAKRKAEEERKNNTYGIHIIGDLDSFYALNTVVNADWEQAGKITNRRYFVQAKKAALYEEAEKNKAANGSSEADNVKETANECCKKNDKQSSTALVLDKKAKEAADAAADIEFWQKEYNYRSSVSKAIHEKLKLKLHQFTDYGIIMDELREPPLIIEKWEDERIFEYSKMEHPRWCAYMRSEGYDTPADGKTKSNTAKTHPDLIPTKNLKKEKLFYDL